MQYPQKNIHKKFCVIPKKIRCFCVRVKVAKRRGLIFIFKGNPGCGNHEKVAEKIKTNSDEIGRTAKV